MQYIKYFGAALTASGEESYWWTQLISAVRFLQSIDDRSDVKSPRRLTADSLPVSSSSLQSEKKSIVPEDDDEDDDVAPNITGHSAF